MIVVEEKELLKMGLSKKVLDRKAAPAQEEKKVKVDANAKATAELAEAIKQLAGKPEPQGQDLSGVVEVMRQTQQTQAQILTMLQKPEKPKKWDFKVMRDPKGGIERIVAKEVG